MVDVVIEHPPWLRFQAYAVGLPKTGSTSVAAVFGEYRSAHEWQLMDLIGAALARQRGELTDAGFLAAVGDRLLEPGLEMDSATSHHMYADVLRDRFPHAIFVLTVRDVRSWVSSLLDMVLRKRIARQVAGVEYSVWDVDYLDVMTRGAYDLYAPLDVDDRDSLPPLLRYWAGHMRTMAEMLPAERTLTVRIQDLADRIGDLAAFAGVPPETLRKDLAHVNKGPVILDRFTAFDSDDLRSGYAEHCADLMAEVFPEEHAAWEQAPQEATGGWQAHVAAVTEWVTAEVEEYGPPTGYLNRPKVPAASSRIATHDEGGAPDAAVEQ